MNLRIDRSAWISSCALAVTLAGCGDASQPSVESGETPAPTGESTASGLDDTDMTTDVPGDPSPSTGPVDGEPGPGGDGTAGSGAVPDDVDVGEPSDDAEPIAGGDPGDDDAEGNPSPEPAGPSPEPAEPTLEPEPSAAVDAGDDVVEAEPDTRPMDGDAGVDTGGDDDTSIAAGSCIISRDDDNDGSVEGSSETIYDEEGRVLRTTSWSAEGEIVTQVTYTYDEEGRVLSEWELQHISNLYSESLIVQEYDEQGNVVSYQTGSYFGAAPAASSPPAISYVVDSSYDADGNLVTETTDEGNDGVVDQTRTVVRNEDGNVLYATLLLAGEEEPRQLSSSTYDENGFLVSQSLTDEFGFSVQVREFENDEEGHPLVETIYSADGSGVEAAPSYIIYYTYDDDGRELSRVEDVGGDGTDDEARLSGYDAVGNRTSFEIQSLAGTGYDYVYLNTYDDQGNVLTDYYAVSEDGVVLNSTEQELDAEGNLLSYTHFDADSPGESYVITWEYSEQAVRMERDDGLNGTVDAVTVSTLDDEGRVVSSEQDTDGDGTMDEVTRYDYECTE